MTVLNHTMCMILRDLLHHRRFDLLETSNHWLVREDILVWGLAERQGCRVVTPGDVLGQEC